MPPEGTETEQQPQATCTTAVWLSNYASGETNRQTDRHTDHNISPPSEAERSNETIRASMVV